MFENKPWIGRLIPVFIKRKKSLGGKWATSFENIILINVSYRQLDICYLLHKSLPAFQKQMWFSPPFWNTGKAFYKSVPKRWALLIHEIEPRVAGSWLGAALGTKAVFQALTSEPSYGGSGRERRMSLHFIDTSGFQFLIVVIVLNTVEKRSFM